MTKIQILGRVLPSAAQINVRMPELEWKWEERRVNLKFRVNISNSVVNVECELEEYKPEFFVEIYKRALDLSRAAVNVVAFAVAIGVTVILETLIGPDGIPSAILLTDPGVVSLVTAYNLDPAGNPEQSAVYEIIVKEAPLMRALNDLIEAITVPHIAPVIRRMISPKEDSFRSPGVGGYAWRP